MFFVLAQTGASGQIYGLRLLRRLLDAQSRVALCLSEAACMTLAIENDLKINAHSPDLEKIAQAIGIDSARINTQVRSFAPRNIAAPIASGATPHDGMIVAPCSAGTLARIAAGTANDLITRAADVTLKEGRKLILLVREMPLSQIHLRNMLTVAQAGATVMPACPHFYHNPQSISDVADTVVDRMLDHVGITEGSMQWRNEQLP